MEKDGNSDYAYATLDQLMTVAQRIMIPVALKILGFIWGG